MSRVLVSVMLLVAAVHSGGAATPNPVEISLWPGETPGHAGFAEPERKYIYQSRIVGPTQAVTNVAKPALTVYRPPAEKNTGTAMLICPGGGYHTLLWDLEGEQVAAWLVSQGMTGIILKYRVPRQPGENRREPPLGPLLDAQRAVSLVRSRATEWGINPNRIGMVGFSAGGHLALATATGFEQRAYDPIDTMDKSSCRPDFAILCYAGFLKHRERDEVWPGTRMPAGTPPIFLTHATDDPISVAENSVIMYLALKRSGLPAELHIYASGNHDFGVRQDGKLPSSWPQLCINWLRSFGLLENKP